MIKMEVYTFGFTLILVFGIQKKISMANERKRVLKFTKVHTMQNVSDTIVQPPISTKSTSVISCAALLMQYGPLTCMEYSDLQSRCRTYHEGEIVDSLISKMDSGWSFYNTDPLRNVTRECKLDPLGTDYRGKLNTTVTGKPCMVWNATSKDKYKNVLVDQEGPEILNTNYCRNPDGWYEGMWCYTVYPRWELCDVPYCHCYT